MEIGNEDWLGGGSTGFENYKKYRFPAFFKAFQEKYPEIQLIASPSVFDGMTIPKPAGGDYHPYLTPDNMVLSFNKFDSLTRDNLTLIGMFHYVLEPWDIRRDIDFLSRRGSINTPQRRYRLGR